MKTAINIFWFRRDLRLDDNIGLFHALNSGKEVLPIFIFDSDILDELENKHDRRVDLIHRCITNLHAQLKEYGSSLLVLHGTPVDCFKKLTGDYDISAVYTNHDYEPYAIARDKATAELLRKQGITLHTFKDQVIFEKDEVVKADGKPYTVFTPYSKVWKNKLQSTGLHTHRTDTEHFFKTKSFALPSLKQLGFEPTDVIIPPLHVDKDILQHYGETPDIPALEGTSHMSVHLRFGTVSIRKLAKTAAAINEQFLNELIWREFFMSILYHFPQVVTHSFKPEYDRIHWRNKEAEFERWCNGTTGYPIVDAGMRQLNETGWMHNRVRMITASFLTKHLLVDWRWGEAYFAEKLLDYELSSNNGNWQWAASCGCDAAPYFRIFNPTEQTKKFDPEHVYIKRWVKEFGTCEYPEPIVEHSFARERALKTYKAALQR